MAILKCLDRDLKIIEYESLGISKLPRHSTAQTAFSNTKLKTKYFPTDNTTETKYEGWNFNSGNYLFTTDTK